MDNQNRRAAPSAASIEGLMEELERIAQSWDGCEYDAPGEMMDIGASLRRAFSRLAIQSAKQPEFSEADIPADAPRAFAKRYSALLGERTALQARVAELKAAQSAKQGAQPSAWISVENDLPKKYCLAVYQTPRGVQRIIRAMYVRQYEIEATGDECDSETNEANDVEYIKAGWYECIDNWGEYSSVAVCEGTVTHWQPLPSLPGAAPAAQVQADVRDQALEEAAQSCMRATPDRNKVREIGEAAHYIACRDAIRELKSKRAASTGGDQKGGA